MSDPLAPLHAPLTTLPGVGPALAERLARATNGPRVLDLLFHLPQSYIDRGTRCLLRDARPGQIATVTVSVIRHEPPATPRQPWRVIIGDESGFAEIAYFGRAGATPAALERLPIGAKRLISGRIDGYGGRLGFSHPDHVIPAERADTLPPIEPVWRLTAGLQSWQIRRSLGHALAAIPTVPEWHDAPLMRREAWPGFAQALRALHLPETPPNPANRTRLAYDELLAQQLSLGLLRRRARDEAGRPIHGDGRLRVTALHRFGHNPTPSQAHALAEIAADLAAPSRMLRLLQGDVGSGKTLVALLAMLQVVEAGYQTALMVPTEILARQHLRLFHKLAPVTTELLTGSVKGAERARILAGLANGQVPIVIGTHALFQSGVAFRDLAFAVVDEQHRFGVDQRLRLGAKGALTELLIMTATPIPRTLLLTQWGEMSVSRLTEKPAGRPPIRTTLHSLATLPAIVDALARALDQAGRAYWVCPLVAESEGTDIAAAEERFAQLRARFGTIVGLVHGRQDQATREKTLLAFASGRLRILVATTVVEVGVDVPEATIMVIDHAERFGLAQLHQLRGRVGRGDAPSFCLLLHADPLPDPAQRRLTLIRDTEDGFLIADEDFRLRGPGEALGTRQSGATPFVLADPELHAGLLHMAHRDAEALLERDPELATDRGQAARLLLRLFNRTEPGRALLAG